MFVNGERAQRIGGWRRVYRTSEYVAKIERWEGPSELACEIGGISTYQNEEEWKTWCAIRRTPDRRWFVPVLLHRRRVLGDTTVTINLCRRYNLRHDCACLGDMPQAMREAALRAGVTDIWPSSNAAVNRDTGQWIIYDYGV